MSFAAGRSNLRLSPEEYAKRLWDWTPLNEAFDRGIRVGDIDGMVECGGKFLFLEGKPPGQPLSKGQGLALQRLAALPGVTVVVVRGHPPSAVVGWEVIGKRNYVGTLEELVAFIRLWFEAANV
jgi:hypothetical protein